MGAPARRTLNGEWSPDPREVLREAERIERAERELRWAEEGEERDARAARQRARLAELRSIRAKLRSNTDGHIFRAGSLLDGRVNERLSDSDFAAFRKAVNAAVTDTDLDRSLAQLEERAAEQVHVTREPGPYQAGSPNSWIRDVLVSAEPDLGGMAAGRSGESDMRPHAVSERLSRHAQDVRRAALIKRDGYGRYIERVLREQQRHEDPDLHRKKYKEQMRELRSGLVTGGGLTASASGGGAAAFVPPAFLMEQWAAPEPYAAFVSQCNSDVQLPGFGMEVYVPQVTAATSVTSETELAGVPEADPTTSLLNAPIVMKAGQVVVSQQFLDRVGPGIAGDAVLFESLRQQLDAQKDAYALSQALANAQSVTNSSAFALTTASGVGGLYGDIKKARSKLTDTAGVRLRATHVFMLDDACDFLLAYADSGGRPIAVPALDDNRLPIRSVGDQNAEGYTGHLLAGLALFGDSNIPNSGSNIQIVVARMNTILHMEAEPVPYLYPPTYAGSLDAVLGVRQYVATVPEYGSGVSVISGSAYAASTFQ